MDFGEKLRIVRTDRGLSQERLAEQLSVSRQAVSKWESGIGYPETEKLLMISRELNVSLDYLLLDEYFPSENQADTPREMSGSADGRISITTFDGKKVVSCLSVQFDENLSAGKDGPRYILSGVDGISFFGAHSVTLAYYETEESAKKEVASIAKAISAEKKEYTLQYQSEVEFSRFLGTPMLKKKT